jgi:Tfp pilus assembly protein PilZ
MPSHPRARPTVPGDNRGTERVPSRLTVRYGAHSPDRQDEVDNISETGLCIHTNQVYKVGTQIRLHLEFPERTIVHTGEVMWAIRVPDHLRESMVCGMGIRFVNPEPGWTAIFRRWKESLARTVG